METSALAGLRAPRESCRNRKMLRVHTVRDHSDIFPLKVLFEEAGSALRDGCKGDLAIGVNSALQRGEQPVVSPAVNPPEKTGMRSWFFLLGARELLQSMKQRMNDHDIRLQTINSRRQHKIVRSTAKKFVPPTQESVQKHPGEK